MKKLLTFLQSNTAVLFGAVAALLTQFWHSMNAFVSLEIGGATWQNYCFGALFAFSTNFAILLFTVRGRKALAYFSLAVEVFVNIIHYNLIGMDTGAIFFSTAFMCLIVPVFITMYSGEIVVEEEVKPSPAIDFGLMDLEGAKSYITEERIKQYPLTPDEVFEVEPTKPAPLKSDSEFVHDIINLVGFDPRNRDDVGNNQLTPSKRDDIRSLWFKRNSMTRDQLISNMTSIINQKRYS